MVRIGVSRDVSKESANGLDGFKVWERMKSQERKGCFLSLYLTLIES